VAALSKEKNQMLKPTKIIFAVTIFFLAFIFSCKKDSTIPTSPSFNYFPTEKGKYVIYDVDSIYHADNDNDTDDSVYFWHFQIKEIIDSSYEDIQGRNVQVLLRYRRDSIHIDWALQNVWTQTLSSSTAYRTEDNVPYHKMSFPIDSKITWNGNDMNTLEEEEYSYEYFHEPDNINALSFDSTLSVLQRDDDNFIQKIYAKEMYANHIGMIYKERMDLLKNAGVIPVTGTEYRMTAVEYGQE
jgi:hypothetical protein